MPPRGAPLPKAGVQQGQPSPSNKKGTSNAEGVAAMYTVASNPVVHSPDQARPGRRVSEHTLTGPDDIATPRWCSADTARQTKPGDADSSGWSRSGDGMVRRCRRTVRATRLGRCRARHAVRRSCASQQGSDADSRPPGPRDARKIITFGPSCKRPRPVAGRFWPSSSIEPRTAEATSHAGPGPSRATDRFRSLRVGLGHQRQVLFGFQTVRRHLDTCIGRP